MASGVRRTNITKQRVYRLVAFVDINKARNVRKLCELTEFAPLSLACCIATFLSSLLSHYPFQSISGACCAGLD